MRLFWVMLLAFGLSGCATTGQQPSQVDRITPEELAKLMPPPVATVTLDEIVALSKAGNTPETIIEKIKASNSRYDLTPTQIVDLNKQGVDSKVLDYIQQSNELAKQNAMADEINKREQAKKKAQEQLQRERRYYDPFWGYGGPGWGPYWGPIGPGGRFWYGRRFGWGGGIGYPYWW